MLTLISYYWYKEVYKNTDMTNCGFIFCLNEEDKPETYLLLSLAPFISSQKALSVYRLRMGKSQEKDKDLKRGGISRDN